MRKNILIGIGILVYLFIFLVTVHADSEQQYQVDSETLTLRNGPDQDADKIATLQNGEKVTVFEESDGWGKTYYDSEPAWAETSKLTDINDKSTKQNQENDSSDESAESGKLYQVKAPALRLRGAPDENATIITELDNGEEVTIFEEADGWGKTYYNGKEGWVALSFLEKSDESADNSTLAANEDEADPSDQETDEEDQSDQEKKEKEEEQSHQETDKNEEDESSQEAKEDEEDDSHQEEEEKEKDDSQREIKGNEDDDSSQEVEENKKDDSSEQVEEDEEDQTHQEAGENDKEKSETESDQQDDESASENENKDKNETDDDKSGQNEEQPLSGYHFVIDPGHGGKDTGTIGSEVDEKALTLSSAQKVAEQLEQKGASVTLTRTDDTFISLGERVQMSNTDDTDAFVSLHYNASEDSSVHGIQTFHGDENQKLASSIHESLTHEVDLSDRGTDQADYEVLRDNEQPALLIELGFISNPEEQETIQTDDYQDKAAKGIVSGLEDYFK